MNNLVQRSFCAFYDNAPRFGRELLENWSSPLGTGPEMISGVPSVVDQYGVHLIDDGIVMLALYQVFRADRHIVTQVVETEFVVRSERDICLISLTASARSSADAYRYSLRTVRGTYKAVPSTRSHVLTSNHSRLPRVHRYVSRRSKIPEG